MLGLCYAPISIATNHRARGEKTDSYLHQINKITIYILFRLTNVILKCRGDIVAVSASMPDNKPQ